MCYVFRLIILRHIGGLHGQSGIYGETEYFLHVPFSILVTLCELLCTEEGGEVRH